MSINKLINLKSIDEQTTLKQHTALTTFKVVKGKYYNVTAEKLNCAIQQYIQQKLFNDFFTMFREKIELIFGKDIIANDLLDILYKNDTDRLDKVLKNISFDNQEIRNIYEEIDKFNKEREHTVIGLTKKQIENTNTLFINKKFENTLISFYENKSKHELIPFEQSIEKNEIINIIKDTIELCRAKSILMSSEPISLNFSKLCKELNITNITFAKKDFKKALEIVFNFNYINKKNKKVEVTTNILSSITFINDEENHTIVTVQVPQIIQQLNLLPEIYASLKLVDVSKMSNKYSFRLYSFLKDYVNFSNKVSMTREEFLTFFTISKAYYDRSHLLKTRILEPTIKELNEITDLTVSYELIPPRNFKEIIFYISQNKNKNIKPIDIEEVKVIKPKKIIIDEKLSDHIKEKIEKAKKNIYVSKSWNKYVDNKIQKIFNEFGQDFTSNLLNELYKSLNSEIETTLVQYINGMLKNMKEPKPKAKKEKRINQQILFEGSNTEETSKIEVKKEVQKEPINIPGVNSISSVIKSTEFKAKSNMLKEKAEENNEDKNTNNDKIPPISNEEPLKEFFKLDKATQENIVNSAIAICSSVNNIEIGFLKDTRRKNPNIFYKIIAKHILELLP